MQKHEKGVTDTWKHFYFMHLKWWWNRKKKQYYMTSKHTCTSKSSYFLLKNQLAHSTLSPEQLDSQVHTCLQPVLNLHFGWPPYSTCVNLHWLVTTCVDFGWAQICMQVDTSFSPFGHPMLEIYSLLWLAWTCEPTANPFGHPSQVHKQCLVLQTCTDLHQLASPFGQGFMNE